MRGLWFSLGLGLAITLALAACQPMGRAPGRTIEIYPSGADGPCDEELVRAANDLRAGDELVLHGGIYSQACGRRIRGIRGTPERPVVIRAAAGETPILTHPRDGRGRYALNNLEIEGVSHVIIRGLTLRGGASGIRFLGVNDHVTLEDNEILETENNAIAMNSGDSDSFVIRRNHIHHTGLLPRAFGTTEGEGLYVGCHDGSCVASNHLIERNYIHHLRGTSEGGNDGVEIKRGSYGNVVRDNVIHDTTIGTRFPCVFVYGGGPRENIVERNALWRCGEAIQVVADAIVRNNIAAYSDVGITAAPHQQVPIVRRVSIVSNTLYGHRECLSIRWRGARDTVLANNAVYCPDGRALEAEGLDEPGVQVRANLVQGAMTAGVRVDGLRFLPGGSASAAFADPVRMDYWPRPAAPLLGAAVPELAPRDDFNGSPRGGAVDVGAYQAGGARANPGWRVAPGFKGE